ncbi:MAG: type II toxin-antitoxin system RelE/ParE family toxin [Acidobacteria bacterium]|nr:type II toxin-antitoxin system RelE/ParE family toxin [Acidobacteriota bacterium]
MKEVVYSRSAVRKFRRMPRNYSSRVREKILAYAEDPESQANNVVRLQGAGGLLRLRVGDWRVIMRAGDRIEVLHIASRGRAYRGDS